MKDQTCLIFCCACKAMMACIFFDQGFKPVGIHQYPSQTYNIVCKHLVLGKTNILTVVLICHEFEVKDIYDVELCCLILGSLKPIGHFCLFLEL